MLSYIGKSLDVDRTLKVIMLKMVSRVVAAQIAFFANISILSLGYCANSWEAILILDKLVKISHMINKLKCLIL